MLEFHAGTRVDQDLFIEVLDGAGLPSDLDLVTFTLFFEHPYTGEVVKMQTYEPHHKGEGLYLAVVNIPEKTPPGSYFIRWLLLDEGVFTVSVDQKFKVLPSRRKVEHRGG